MTAAPAPQTSPITNIASRRWAANRNRQTFSDRMVAELHARPITMRCACGWAYDATDLADGRAEWALHECHEPQPEGVTA